MAKRRTPTSIEDAQRELERLRREIERSQHERERLREENAQLGRDRARLRRDVERLTQALDAARRAGYRQAAPFSKGAPSAAPRPPGRKRGAAYGPVARVLTRAFTIHIGHCQTCGRRVQGRHPWQNSDALGAAAVQLGPEAVALAAVLNKQLGLSFAKIATLLRQQVRLTVTRSGLEHAVHRAHPTYRMLQATVRGSPVVAPDETGWKVGGRLQWLWGFATPDTTVYAIQPGRGFDEAAAILGPTFGGALEPDGWAPYRRFTTAVHQTCLAHGLRRCRLLRADHPRAAFLTDVQATPQAALTVRDRRDAGTLSAHGVAVARGRLAARLNRRLEAPGTLPAAQRVAAHLATEFPAVFTFLLDPTIDATNWRAEQALRPAVTRKVSGGNRTWRGAQTQQTLASMIRTACQRHLDPHALLVGLLCTPTPTIAPTLQPPSQ